MLASMQTTDNWHTQHAQTGRDIAGMHSMHRQQWTTPLAGRHKHAQTTMIDKGLAGTHKHAQTTTMDKGLAGMHRQQEREINI